MQRKSENKTTSEGRELITVRGVVTPSEWDMRDEVTAVTIYALDETEYVVNVRAMVKRLMKHTDEEIEAHGFVTQDEYGSDVFMVNDFAPLDVADGDGQDDDWEDEDGLVEAEDWDDEDDTTDAGGDEEDWGKGDGDEGGGGWKARRRR